MAGPGELIGSSIHRKQLGFWGDSDQVISTEESVCCPAIQGNNPRLVQRLVSMQKPQAGSTAHIRPVVLTEKGNKGLAALR